VRSGGLLVEVMIEAIVKCCRALLDLILKTTQEIEDRSPSLKRSRGQPGYSDETDLKFINQISEQELGTAHCKPPQ
jgi:hypothetical protein